MHTTVTPKQRVLATLVKWTSLFLILLAVMATTISGELPIARTTFSRTSVPSSFKASTCPDAPSDALTPSPMGGQCAFVPAKQGECGPNYHDTTAQTVGNTVTVEVCTTAVIPGGNSSGNNSSGPPPSTAAPNIQGLNNCSGNTTQTTVNGQTECQVNGGGPGQFISPSCAADFVNVNNQCYSNQTFDLVDQSTSACTLTPQGEEGEGGGEEGGAMIYWCPYANNTQLLCMIYGTIEYCKMTNGDTLLDWFTCQNINAGYPRYCLYYGNSDSGPPLAAATCGKGTCSIRTCFNTISQTFRPIAGTNCPPSPSVISATITEKCTAQVDAQVRKCDYNSTNGISSKTETISVTCNDPSASTLACTAANPYAVAFNKTCVTPDQAPDSQAECNIAGSNGALLWIEQCSSTGGSSTIPDCEVDSGAGSNLALGKMNCTGNTCTTTDNNNNGMTLTCAGSAHLNPCHSTKPDCPHIDVPSEIAITEATIVCDGNLLADMFMYKPSVYSIIYPLSQAELEFALTRLGAGSQTWSHANLPDVAYL